MRLMGVIHYYILLIHAVPGRTNEEISDNKFRLKLFLVPDVFEDMDIICVANGVILECTFVSDY